MDHGALKGNGPGNGPGMGAPPADEGDADGGAVVGAGAGDAFGGKGTLLAKHAGRVGAVVGLLGRLAAEQRGHGDAIARIRAWSGAAEAWASRLGEVRALDELARADAGLRAAAADEATELRLLAAGAAEEAVDALAAVGDEDAAALSLARDTILEVRAGTGGQEAMLFTGEVLAMYRAYAARQRWRWEPLAESPADQGGLREASATVRGRGAAARLRFESGVHRVQRVPDTEKLGRVHTSTATVAVLPVPEETDVRVEPRDIRIDTYRASGRGGQHVNTTDSAVRIVHIPTGIIVAIQDERSQHQNKAKAMELLRARLFEQQRSARAAERAAARREQIGSAARSDRIRTYNYPQNRVTDHRVGVSILDVPGVLDGSRIDDIIDRLELQAAELSMLRALDDIEARVLQLL
jgi:peptide chain release factor 1